jgi:peptidoglycan/xylan/chitin deacetylase (PgdA/CDA1 family)
MYGASGDRATRRAAARRRLRRQRIGAAAFVIVVVAGVVAGAMLLTGRPARHRPRVLVSRTPAALAHSVVPAAVRHKLAAERMNALAVAHIRRLVALGQPIYCGAPRGNEVAFTFDDGPGPYTFLALHKLAAAGERATFFVVGRSIENFPGRLGREAALASIGDHTELHLDLAELTPAAATAQIVQPRALITAATGSPVRFFRPPYGATDPIVAGIIRRLGLLEILWSVDSRDSLGANWAGIIRNVEAGLHPGAIILMHENHGQTIRALTTLLPVLHARHLRSVSLMQLFADDPPSPAQVLAGERACYGASAPVRGDG